METSQLGATVSHRGSTGGFHRGQKKPDFSTQQVPYWGHLPRNVWPNVQKVLPRCLANRKTHGPSQSFRTSLRAWGDTFFPPPGTEGFLHGQPLCGNKIPLHKNLPREVCGAINLRRSLFELTEGGHQPFQSFP